MNSSSVTSCLAFARLSRKVAAELLSEFAGLLPESIVVLALDQAEAMAHNSGFPHLVLPQLAREIVAERARKYAFIDSAAA